MYWYVVITKKKFVNSSVEYLNNLGIKTYVPTVNQASNKKSKTKQLIPGYIFVFFLEGIDYQRLNSTPFTLNLLRFQGDLVKISELEMNKMINHLESNYKSSDLIDKSIGDKIEISYGILDGLSGVVEFISNNKIRIMCEANKSIIEISLS